MLKDNLAMLRNIHGYSQEGIAEKSGYPDRLMRNGKAVRLFPILKNARFLRMCMKQP
jgi:hypothetical protein